MRIKYQKTNLEAIMCKANDVKKVDGHYEIDGYQYRCESGGVFRLQDDPDGFGGKEFIFCGSRIGQRPQTAVARIHDVFMRADA